MNSIEVSDTFAQHKTSPPFPDGVPFVPLLRISLLKLLTDDEKESKRLYAACKDLGFFYLDLEGSSKGQSILEDANKLFSVGEQLFDLELEEKQSYEFSGQKSYYGYKGYGTSIIDKTGILDRNEFYNVSKDDILGLSEPLPCPTVLKRQKVLLRSYMVSAHAIVCLLLEHLNRHLKLPPSKLASLHRLYKASGDQVRFVKAPQQPLDDRRTALGEHTDFGSVTVLFNRLGGLQVLPPGEGAKWCYVKPLPGHCIINLGDAMVKFTNGLLRSNIHRVVSPPGLQAEHTRYSLVYFARPEDDVLLKRLDSPMIPPPADGETEEVVNSKDWITRRAISKRVGVFKEEEWERNQGTERISARSLM
ncbi:hypothetical protein P7C71_g212, partial [Lecanoromycetidae sp. Uapishka_2]